MSGKETNIWAIEEISRTNDGNPARYLITASTILFSIEGYPGVTVKIILPWDQSVTSLTNGDVGPSLGEIIAALALNEAVLET